MKKIISIFLSSLMILSLLSVMTFAAESDVVIYTDASTTSVHSGDTFSYTVSLSGTYDGFSFWTMSENGITVTDVTTADPRINADKKDDGDWEISVMGAWGKVESEKEEIATITAQVDTSAAIGDISLSLGDIKIANDIGDPVACETKYDAITVEEVPPEPKKDFPKTIKLSDKTYTYDGTEKSISVSGTLPAGTNVTYENEKATDVGVYNVKATLAGDGYNTKVLTAKMTIEPKKLTVSGMKAQDKSYDATTEAKIEGGEISGKVTGDDVGATFPTTGTFASANAGRNIAVNIADITLTGSKKDNYTLTQPTGLKANITAAPITVTADNVTVAIGEEIPKLTYKITSGQLYGSDTIDGELKTNARNNKVGTYDITKGTLTTTANYKLTFINGKLTVVDKIPQNITVSEIGEKTYGDEAFKIEVTGDAVSGLSAFTFESSNTDVCEIDETGVITIKNAGETEITVREAGDDKYAPFKNTQKLTVNAKSINVKNVNVMEKTAELDGVLSGDEVSADLSEVTMEIKELGEENAVVLVKGIKLAGEKAKNYAISQDEVEATVGKGEIITVSAEAVNGSVSGTGAYVKGSSVTLKAEPDKRYRFDAWYDGENKLSSKASYTVTAEKDITVTAQFNKKSSGGGSSTYYIIDFVTNGGSSVETQKLKFGAAAVKPKDPTRDGYIFAGWFTDSELKNKYDFSNKVYNDFKLYAAWNEDLTTRQIILTIDKKSAIVFGKVKTNDVAPIIVKERTMLPARFVAENLGADVEWDNDKRQVIITKADTKIVITIDSDIATVNGKEVKLDSEAFIKDERTYTPIRFISESLGAKVEWNNDTREVIITK